MVSDSVERDAGDFGFDPLGLLSLLTPQTDYQYGTSELALLNGRTAMPTHARLCGRCHAEWAAGLLRLRQGDLPLLLE